MRLVTAASADKTVQPSMKGSSGAHTLDLDQVVHHREPDEAMVFGPLRFRLYRLESFGRIGTEPPRWVVNAEFHQDYSRSSPRRPRRRRSADLA